MFEDTAISSSLRPRELEAVYAISNAVSQASHVEGALDEIIRLSRPVFIFDNMAVFLLNEDQQLEPRYARVIGRGRSAGEDLEWGTAIALAVIRVAQTLTSQEKLSDWESNRLSFRLLLGLPLRSPDGVIGALVFGRFGGPVYTIDQIHLSEFISVHIAQLLVRSQLTKKIADLEAVRRLHQLQEKFIATVSHELCTPLGFIKGYATTLLRQDTRWDEATSREFLTIIDEEADRLRELIDNLLDSSRLQAGTLQLRLQDTNLNSLLQDIVQRGLSRYPGLTITMEPVAEKSLHCDPARLAQVFDNLISNAVKYAPGAKISISCQITGDQCQILFSDQGPGIPAVHLERMFERFFRVPETSAGVHGTGLGLFISREIIRSHGGDIVVESEVGRGTTFHITLPLPQSAGTGADEKIESREAEGWQKKS